MIKTQHICICPSHSFINLEADCIVKINCLCNCSHRKCSNLFFNLDFSIPCFSGSHRLSGNGCQTISCLHAPGTAFHPHVNIKDVPVIGDYMVNRIIKHDGVSPGMPCLFRLMDVNDHIIEFKYKMGNCHSIFFPCNRHFQFNGLLFRITDNFRFCTFICCTFSCFFSLSF